MKKTYIFIVLAALTTSPLFAQQSALTIDQLLENVEQGKVNDNSENKKREAEFRQKRDQQDSLLSEAVTTKVTEENRSTQLEAIFEVNEAELNVLQDTLTERLGALKELFGVMQQVAGDARTRFDNSLTNVQYPDRSPFLEELAKKIGSNSKLPSIDEIERLWFELQREMTETGKVVKFTTDVIDVDGVTSECSVTRVGLFNAVCDGKYLEYASSKGQYAFLPRQPAGRYTKTAKAVGNASVGDQVRFGIDPTGPTGGSLLANLIQTPSLMERAQQGREVGYAIIAVGIIAVLFAFYKLYSLYMIGTAVRKQANQEAADVSNPLGRVLKVGKENFDKDIDTLELKLAEAIMAERPAIDQGIGFIKIISVIAPLAGLLGTVTGMIVTFQMITLYGTGDPKLMAGGISQALVTTVLGLLVAIPTSLLHSFTQSSARGIVSILEEQSTGILAERAESK